MANTYKDPFEYLNDLILKRGKSGKNSVYVTNVTVVVDSQVDYDYKVPSPGFDLLDPFPEPLYPDIQCIQSEWLHLLVSMRDKYEHESYTILLKDRLYQLIPEGQQLSMNVFVPRLFANHFKYEVLHSQEMLNKVATFLGSTATTIRFNIGLASKTWEELTEEGEVTYREVDLSY
jgi:hypothetical protein